MDETSNEFINIYIKTLFTDIDGKNKELILLKTNAEIAELSIAALKAEIENLSLQLKESELKRLNIENDYNRDVSILREKLQNNEQRLINYDSLERNYIRLNSNYELAIDDLSKLRSELNSVKKKKKKNKASVIDG